MGQIRNGARTMLNIIAHACKLSKLPGFRPAVITILGESNGPSFLNLWDPLCALTEVLISADNYFNQIDTRPEDDGDEDLSPLV
jgi:hypothetical protein